ncbi:MAG: hypothetical protein VKN33_10325 [Candidatus Sericytochromatia bacterium]|nr:hypothetical protein [Candidatus Sericytochromatia bacterium]
MNKSKQGGYADYDDPDFDSEWFDDEAYDRALAQGYDDDSLESNVSSQVPPPRARHAAPPSRTRSEAASPLPMALAGLFAVVLAASAGYYLVAKFAGSGLAQRVQAAYSVLRGKPSAPAPESEEKSSPAAIKEPGPSPESPTTSPAAAAVPALLPSAAPAATTTTGAADGELPVDEFGPSGPSAPSVAPVDVAPSPVKKPPSPKAMTPGEPSSPPRLPAQARKPVGSPSLPSLAPEALPPKRLNLIFAPNVVAVTTAQVEALWTFIDSLEGQSGRFLVQGYLGYGRLAPALAQQRAQSVAGVLRRHLGRSSSLVDVRVSGRPVQGIAGRKVEVIFTPSAP